MSAIRQIALAILSGAVGGALGGAICGAGLLIYSLWFRPFLAPGYTRIEGFEPFQTAADVLELAFGLIFMVLLAVPMGAVYGTVVGMIGGAVGAIIVKIWQVVQWPILGITIGGVAGAGSMAILIFTRMANEPLVVIDYIVFVELGLVGGIIGGWVGGGLFGWLGQSGDR